MYFTLGKEEQLNDLLNRIGEKLQLDNSRKERAKTSYQALCTWIETDEKYFSKYTLDFYAQGSYRTGTTVKPVSGEEFDLDFVLEIKGDWKTENPLRLLKELARRLSENGTYESMLEVKTRCIRINYANEFHIDILPGFPESIYSSNTKIKVPDRELKDWTDSNPKGFADWFDDISNKVNTMFIEKRAVASVEPLPESPPYGYIEPLRRAVQLIKRFRDIYYLDKNVSGVRSIVITTLAANYYNGEKSAYEAILSILNGIQTLIIKSEGKPIDIYNPSNIEEKLSEKWDDEPKLYSDFCEFIKYFSRQWTQLNELESLEEKAIILQELFGEKISKDALIEQVDYVNKYRTDNKLAINTSTGVLTAAITSSILDRNLKVVQKNTFYGE
jgi:hypothetical protein